MYWYSFQTGRLPRKLSRQDDGRLPPVLIFFLELIGYQFFLAFRHNTITKILDSDPGAASPGRASLDRTVEMANESDSEMTGALPTLSGAKNPPAPGLGASKHASLDNLVRDKPAQVKEPAPKPQAKPAKVNGIPSLLNDADAVRE